MKHHKFWAWATVFCFAMVMYTGYKHKRSGSQKPGQQALNRTDYLLINYIFYLQEEFKMLDVKKCLKLKNVAVFAGGVLFGTAGIKVLGSQDAKKLYINCLAAGLRAKECVMTTASNIQANAEDVLAEAKEINRARAEEAFGEEEEAAEDFTETTEKAEDAE